MKPIFYTETLFEEISLWLEKAQYSQVIFLVDENTHKHCLPLLLSELATNTSMEIIELESGEENKNLDTCKQIWLALTDFHADRKSLLINVGGGVITDMGGFVASTYLRGIDFVNFPTSLLSMVDASVGGKTGIDLDNLKNRVGTFAFAEKVWIVPPFLHTLPHEELISGFAEMLKHGLIADAQHFYNLNALETITVENISPFIQDSVLIKYNIIEEDPKEKGLRKILNFGHTIGHAIETYALNTTTPLLHGMAVAIGMYYESQLAYNLGILAEDQKEIVQNTLKKWYKIPTYSIEEIEAFIKLMYADKKNSGKNISFSLIDQIGHCEIDIFVEENEIKTSLLN